MKREMICSAVLIHSLALAITVPAQGNQPVNPNASTATRQVLAYFHSLTTRSDKRVVSGQFLDHGTQANLEEVAAVHKMTGHWLGMVGGDYYGRGVTPDVVVPEWSEDADWTVTNPLFIDYWKHGGLVTLCLHAFNPQSEKSAWMKRNGDTINLADVLTPGRPGNDAWIRQLDLIATGLQELEDEGVVVLLRPFHEMNGDWFWWGSANNRENFIKLWRHMYRYMTATKRLDNLLWVYSPGCARGDPLRFYPGEKYVDIVGLDSYGRSPAEIRNRGYATLTDLGKPFGLTEFGPYRQLNYAKEPRKDYEYGKFIRGIKESLPLCTFFVIWHQNHGLHFQQNAQQCLDHPWTVNRADLPAFGRSLPVSLIP